MKRWYAAAGAILIHLCLGVLFAWPVFVPKLCDRAGSYAFTETQANLIFILGLIVFALAASGSGWITARVGSRKTALAGGAMLGAGYILAGLFGKSFAAQLIFISIMGGLGVGFGYVVAIAVVVKWFPDKKGFITGLVVAGFGFGELIWMNTASSWFDLLNRLSLFGLDGIRSVFLLYGMLFLILILIGSRFLAEPPLGYSPPEWSNGPATESGSGSMNFELMEMLKTPQFVMLWVAFFLSAVTGLTLISNIVPFGMGALRASGLEPQLATEAAGWALSSLLVLNGLGRVTWGSLSDNIGRRWSIFIMSLFQGIVLLLLCRLGSDPKFLILSACIIGFNFGGNFALFPVITADYFGNRSLGKNYGYLLLSFGAAAIVGPAVAASLKSAAQASSSPSVWTLPFVIAGVACLVSAGLAFCCNPPKKK